MTRLSVQERGLRGAEDLLGGFVDRGGDLRPTGRLIRRRWLESERRTFGQGSWRRRATSTRERYTRPGIRSGLGKDRRTVGTPGSRTLVLSGRLRHGLTTEKARGQLFTVRRTKGGLSIRMGVTNRGPLAHAQMTAAKGRDPVEIDPRAINQSASDVTDYILHGRAAGR